jgi:hypothetical protein
MAALSGSRSTNMHGADGVVVFHPRDNALVASTYGHGFHGFSTTPGRRNAHRRVEEGGASRVLARWPQWDLCPRATGEGNTIRRIQEFNPAIAFSATVPRATRRSRSATPPATGFAPTRPGRARTQSMIWDMHMDAATPSDGQVDEAGAGWWARRWTWRWRSGRS